MTRALQIDATWDGDAAVWVAESADVPGLVAVQPVGHDLASGAA